MNRFSIHELMRREKYICTSVTVAPQNEKAMAIQWVNCLVEMEKALNLYTNIFWETSYSHNFYYSMF